MCFVLEFHLSNLLSWLSAFASYRHVFMFMLYCALWISCRYDSKLFSWTSGGSTIYCFLLPGSKHLIFWRMIFSGRLIVTLLVSLLYHYLPYRNSGCINDWHHLFLILLLSESFRLSWNFNLRSDGLYWLGFYSPPNRPCFL